MPIVAAVDRSERATVVVERAAELADKYDVDLHIVHVGDPSVDFTEVSEDALREKHEVTAKTVIEDAQHAATLVAREIGDSAEGVGEFEAIGLVGDAAEVIRTYADECDADYIVVCGRKRRPLGQALFGSVTQSLLLNADRPIVAVPYDLP